MRRILFSILLVAFVVVLSYPVSAQPRGGPLGDIFQGQPPPAGAVSVLGRSFFGAMEDGFHGSLALLIGVDDRNFREELGMTDTEANSVRLLRGAMLVPAAQYATRFRNMDEGAQAGMQADLLRDMRRITESLNTALPQERRDNVQKLVFQSIGGLDSPIINLNMVEVLELSDTQKGRLKSVFDEVQEERAAQMEKILGIAEKIIAVGGPQNLSPEEQEELRRQGQELEVQVWATSRKLTEQLRQHLTPEQLERERQLIASRPAFLPPLPPQIRDRVGQNQGNTGDDGSGPGAGAWRPGDDLPVQILQPRSSRFPRGEN